MCEIKGKKLRIFEDKEGILVIRNGRAGTTVLLKKGKYTITDHAYILSLKEPSKYRISLKWLITQYRHTFLEYASSPDNGTWNMTGFFENVVIDIPSYEEQIDFIKEFQKLEDLENKLNQIKNEIKKLLSKEISAN